MTRSAAFLVALTLVAPAFAAKPGAVALPTTSETEYESRPLFTLSSPFHPL